MSPQPSSKIPFQPRLSTNSNKVDPKLLFCFKTIDQPSQNVHQKLEGVFQGSLANSSLKGSLCSKPRLLCAREDFLSSMVKDTAFSNLYLVKKCPTSIRSCCDSSKEIFSHFLKESFRRSLPPVGYSACNQLHGISPRCIETQGHTAVRIYGPFFPCGSLISQTLCNNGIPRALILSLVELVQGPLLAASLAQTQSVETESGSSASSFWGNFFIGLKITVREVSQWYIGKREIRT